MLDGCSGQQFPIAFPRGCTDVQAQQTSQCDWKDEMPKVSIVVPTYNAAPFLAEMIESALGQTFEDFEFLLLDSASSDDTVEIIRSYDDKRIVLTELPFVCEGAIKRNLGISQASGDYVAMMDADDIMQPERLEKQVAFFQENADTHVVGSNFLIFDGEERSSRVQPAEDAVIKANFLTVFGNGLHTPTTMVRRDFLIERSVFFPVIEAGEGQVFWNNCMRAGAAFANIQEELLLYRKHGANQTTVRQKAYLTGRTPVREELLLMYFPHITRAEAGIVAHMMEEERTHEISELATGVAIIEKIASFRTCAYGADIRTVLRILERHYVGAKQKMARALSRSAESSEAS